MSNIRKATVTDFNGNQYTLGTDGKRVWLSNQHQIPMWLGNIALSGKNSGYSGRRQAQQAITDAVLNAKDVAAALNKCTCYTNWKAA